MKRLLFTVLIILVLALLMADEVLIVKRNHSVLREGPGSFYPVVAFLKVDSKVTVLEKSGKWVKILYDDKIGYVSEKAFKVKKIKEDYEGLGKTETQVEIAQSGLTAGIKGFAEKISKKLNSDPSFLTYFLNYNISPKKFKKFKKQTYKKISFKKARRWNKLPPAEKTEEYTFPEQGLGLAIAAKIASLGLYRNKKVTDYINYVGNLVVDASDGYDQNFKFFVLDIDNPNAYSCPGGIVFITKGMLKIVDNEAELACVLGHEIAHNTRKHGMKEVERRVNDIYAENAFSELDKELQEIGHKEDKKYAATEKELEELSQNLYEVIIKGRLTRYEAEADRLALLYATRAGYDPKQMLNLLAKMRDEKIKSNNLHYSQNELINRIKRIKKDLKKLRIPKKTLKNKKRAKKYLGNI